MFESLLKIRAFPSQLPSVMLYHYNNRCSGSPELYNLEYSVKWYEELNHNTISCFQQAL